MQWADLASISELGSLRMTQYTNGSWRLIWGILSVVQGGRSAELSGAYANNNDIKYKDAILAAQEIPLFR